MDHYVAANDLVPRGTFSRNLTELVPVSDANGNAGSSYSENLGIGNDAKHQHDRAKVTLEDDVSRPKT